MTACARGCTVPLRHVTACTCGSDGHQHDDTCQGCEGCQPAQATLGLLCGPDIGRIRRALHEAPDLAGWVRENVERGAAPEGRRAGGKRTPAPLNLAAVDDADDLAALLWGHAEPQIERGLTGPSTEGLRIRPKTRHLVLDEEAETAEEVELDPAVIGLRPGADPIQAVSNVAGWLNAHLAALVSTEGAGDIHDEITERIREIRNRWPQSDHNRKLPLPCPACNLAMLYLHPPAGPPARDAEGNVVWAHEHLVHCHNDDCNNVMSHDSYYLKATTALAERKRRAA